VRVAKKSVIVIGSGLGGLVAGNLLAKRGHPVTIFESHSSPGGYIAGFYRKGFYFESGTLSFEGSASIFKSMRDIGVFDRVSFVRHRGRWVSEEFDSIVDSYDDLKRMLSSAFPSERPNLDQYFSAVDELYDATSGIMKRPSPFLERGLPFFWSLPRFIFSGMKFIRLMKKYQNLTIGEFNTRFFEKGSRLERLLSGLGYPDMGAWMVGGAMVMIEDYWTVSGGMQSWADALADNFKSHGGNLRLNAYVDGIITKDGAAAGVSSKDTIFHADAVISACDYKKTFLKLLDNRSLIPVDLLEGMEKAPVSEGFFTVYLGLGLSNDQLREQMKIPYVLFFDEKPGADVNNPDDEDFFEKVSFTLYSPSMMNPNLAPQGKSSIMIHAFSPSGWMHNWGDGNREEYRRLKEKARKALIRRAEAVIPNLSTVVEFEDAATPLTYERYTHNTDGASSAWSWNPKKRFFSNMMGMKVDTPVRNLYIGSCWANQIGGVPGALMAAYLCAKKIR